MKMDVEMINTNEQMMKKRLQTLEIIHQELIKARESEKEKVRKLKKDIFKGIRTEGESVENLLLNIDYYNQKINENEQLINELKNQISLLNENEESSEEEIKYSDLKKEEDIKGKSKKTGNRRTVEISSIFEEFDEIEKNGQVNGNVLSGFKRRVKKVLAQYRHKNEVSEEIKSIDEQIADLEAEVTQIDTELSNRKKELNALKKARREEKKKVEMITDRAVEGISTDTSQIEHLSLNISYLNEKIYELPSKKRQLKAQIRKLEKQKISLSKQKTIEENEKEFDKLNEIYYRVNSNEFKKKAKRVKKDKSEQNISRKEKDRQEFIKKVEQERNKFLGISEKESEKVTVEETKRKAEEEAKKKAEEEAKRKAEEDAKKKTEEEAKRKAEEDAKKKAEEEAKRKAEEDAKKKAEEEAKRKAEEDAKKKAEEEAKRKAEEDAKKKAEEEAKRKAEEDAKKKAEVESKRKAEEDANKKAKSEKKKGFFARLFEKILNSIKFVVSKIKEKFSKKSNIKQNTAKFQKEHISNEGLWKVETMRKLRDRIVSELDGKIDAKKYEFDENVEQIIDDEAGFLKNLYNGLSIPVDERKRFLCDVFKKVYRIQSYNDSYFGNDLDEIYDERKSRRIFKDIIKGKFDYKIQRYKKNEDFTGKKLSSETRYLQKAIDISMQNIIESAKKSKISSNLVISRDIFPDFDRKKARKIIKNFNKKIDNLEDQKFLEQIELYQLSYYFDNIDLKRAIEDVKETPLQEVLKKISQGEYEIDIKKKKEDNIWVVPEYEWKRTQSESKVEERVIKPRVLGIG